MGGSFPIDLVLFGMIAAFLVLRLRSILGRRTGFERPAAPMRPAEARPDGHVIDGRAEPTAPARRSLPAPDSAVGRALADVQRQERGFSAASFLGGAEKAFRIIVAAYAAGDRAALRPLLADDIYAAFEQAIAAREAARETQHSEIRAIENATIEAAMLRNGIAAITVRFVSDQVSYTTADDGSVAAGAEAVTELTDVWTFERELGARDPTWRLVAARSA